MKSRSIFPKILIVLLLSVLAYGGYLFYEDSDGPMVVLEPNTGFISPESQLTLKMEDISKVRSVEVILRYKDQVIPVFSKHFSPYQTHENVQFSFKNVPVPEGKFALEIKAKDASLASFGLGNSTILTLPVTLDSVPPKVSMLSSPPTIRRGGAGVLYFSVNEGVLNSGIQLGEHFFPAYMQEDKNFICLFAFPHNMKMEDFKPKLVVSDLAGNTVRLDFRLHANDRKFKEDTIKITDRFLESVSQKLYDLAPSAANPLERFLIINSDIRLANTTFLYELGQKSQDKLLWQGAFMRLPRSASRAGYGEYRSYTYKGKVIDNQWHLGHDLASVKEDKVPAANNGTVVFTGNVGIYGNLVVVDHGLGLMSLYSHLTDITTKQGNVVKKGDIIGTTGVSGMAFGDHLHFGILVNGIEVSPLEWLDPKWILHNVTNRISSKK